MDAYPATSVMMTTTETAAVQLLQQHRDISSSTTKASTFHANKDLSQLFTGQSKRSSVLLFGPSGVWKIDPVESCVTFAGVKLKRLQPQDLSDNKAGVVEATTLITSNSAVFDHESDNHTAVCHVIFTDDLDICAPSKMKSHLHFTIVATLNGFLQDVV